MVRGAEIASENYHFLAEFYESASNRNYHQEVKANAQAAIDRNLNAIVRIAEARGWLTAAKGLSDTGRFDVAGLSEPMLPAAWLVLLSRIEYTERALSRRGHTLPKQLAPLVVKREVAATRSTNTSNPKWVDAHSERWFAAIEDFAQLLTRKKIVRGASPEMVLATEFLLLFRAVREQESVLHEVPPEQQRIERAERTLRALVYSRLCKDIGQRGSRIESDLVQARLARVLGESTNDLWALSRAGAALTSAVELGRLRTYCQQLEMESEGLTLPDPERYRTVASLIPRALNDLGRLAESAAVVVESCRLSDLDATPVSWVDDKRYHSVAPAVVRRIGRLRHLAFPGVPPSEPTVREWISELARATLSSVKTWAPAGDEWHDVPRLRLQEIADDVDTTTERPQVLLLRLAEELFTWVAADKPLAFFARPELLGIPADKVTDVANERYKMSHIALHNHGRILARQGHLAAAIADYRRATATSPTYAPAHESLGLALLKLGDGAIASRHFAEAKRLYERNHNVRANFLETNLGAVVTAQDERKTALAQYLTRKRCLSKDRSPELLILKRWNSYTPSLPGKPHAPGGGYLLTAGGRGVAVDPGFDFLRHLGEVGFSMSDIDIVAVTHLHSDHMADLEPLLFLLFERQKRAGKTDRKVAIVAPEEVANRIAQRSRALLTNLNIWKDITFVVPPQRGSAKTTYRVGRPHGDEKRPWNFVDCDKKPRALGDLDFWSAPAIHMKATFSVRSKNAKPVGDCSGFIVGCPVQNKEPILMGFTGDTAWFPGIESYYEGCEVLTAHMGDIYLEDLDSFGQLCPDPPNPKTAADRSHLGLGGVFHLVKSMDDPEKQPSLLLVGEFGEEIGENKLGVSAILRREMMHQGLRTFALAADIGTRVRVDRPDGCKRPRVRVLCRFCGGAKYRDAYEMRELYSRSTSADGAIVQFCNRHNEEDVADTITSRASRSEVIRPQDFATDSI